VGSSGTILRYTASKWSKLPAVAGLDPSLALYAVWADRGTGNKVIYAACDQSVMVSQLAELIIYNLIFRAERCMSIGCCLHTNLPYACCLLQELTCFLSGVQLSVALEQHFVH
jgi:hypothetical protein